jgi:pimeloyl-ACP methyl ester carboxylesterase
MKFTMKFAMNSTIKQTRKQKMNLTNINRVRKQLSGASLALRSVVALFVLAAMSASAVSFASDDECATQTTQGVEWSYCISKTDGSRNPDLAYFFHGIYGSENDWSNDRKIQEAWNEAHLDAPTVVSVSFGNVWLLSSKEGSELTGKLMDIFLHTVIPQIEKQLGGLRGKRLLIGKSMGGFNAAEVYLWNPELFSAVALLCPALSPISPYASDEDVQNFIERTSSNPFLVHRARDVARTMFTTEAQWNAISPQLVASTLIKGNSPRLYVSIGREDGYGFFGGAEEFSKVAQSKAVSDVQWVPVDGGHCAFDPLALVRFLVK